MGEERKQVSMWDGQLAIHCGGSLEKYPMPELWQQVVVTQRTQWRKLSEVERTSMSEGMEVVGGGDRNHRCFQVSSLD